MSHKVELDTYEPENADFQTALEQLGIKHKVVNPHGPGGGNPVVLYEGSKESLEQMIDEQFYDGAIPKDMSYLKELITEA